MFDTEFRLSKLQGFLRTRWHARVLGILERYFGDIWRKFGGRLEEFCRKCAGHVEDVKRRLEGKSLVFEKLIF